MVVDKIALAFMLLQGTSGAMLLPAEPVKIASQDKSEHDRYETPFFTGSDTAVLPDAYKGLSARELAPQIASLLYRAKHRGEDDLWPQVRSLNHLVALQLRTPELPVEPPCPSTNWGTTGC